MLRYMALLIIDNDCDVTDDDVEAACNRPPSLSLCTSEDEEVTYYYDTDTDICREASPEQGCGSFYGRHNCEASCVKGE